MKTKPNLNYLNIVLLVCLVLVFTISFLDSDVQAQYNYDHVNVTVTVNITNAYPEILNMSLDGSTDNLTLSAGGTRTVFCNATIRDWGGFNTIDTVNATLYYYLNSSEQSDDNNEHYTNSSCAEIENDGAYIANYSCSFQVYYYAYNGTWNCNLTVNDTSGFTTSNNTSTIFNKLYALNVTDLIDYGNLSVTDTSDNITAIITNFGNVPLNVTVLGYGLTEGDGIGLICQYGNNISIEHQRFSPNFGDDWSAKTPLSAVNQDMGLTLDRQTDDLTQVTNTTYWQLYVPPNPFGICNGTVRFTAAVP